MQKAYSSDSESTDEPIVANRHHERHVASLECEEGSSDDDAPLARLLQPSTAFTTSDEGRSNDSDDHDEHRPLATIVRAGELSRRIS